MEQRGDARPGPGDAAQALLPLHAAEIKLLVLMRQMGYGVLHEVHIAEGQPVLIEKQCEKIKLF